MRAQEFLAEDEPVRIKIGGAEAAAKARTWIEKVYARYPQTMQNNHVMTWGSGDDLQFAMFELTPSFSKRGAVEVKWFQAYPLRAGVGSRAMKELQSLAREDGISLTLFPWDKGQVSQAKLTKFYRGQGFSPTVKGGKAMAWTPELAEGVEQRYLTQISNLAWKPLTRSVWNTIQDEGLDEEQDAPKHTDWVMASLDVSAEDAQALQSFDDNAIEDFNRFDIQLKSRYPGLTDLIDYDNGTVTIVKPLKQGVAEDKEKNHWYDAGVKDATRGARPNPRTYLPALKDKQAKHPEEVDFYMNGYKSVKQGVAEGSLSEKINPKTLTRGFVQEKDMGWYTLQAVGDFASRMANEPPTMEIYAMLKPAAGKRQGTQIGQLSLKIAQGMFLKDNPGAEALVAGGVDVDPAYQRKGVASAMYAFAKELGNDVIASVDQSDDAKAMWTGMRAKGVTESLRVDVPNEEWLEDAIEYAKRKSPTHYGLPYMGKTTATVRQVEVPVNLLRRIPGMRREQQNVRYNDLAAIEKIMKDTGKLPIHSHSGEEYKPFINVAYDGSAWVNEGNHRIMAAYRLGWDTLPVEISYFDGGERVESGPMYPGKIGL